MARIVESAPGREQLPHMNLSQDMLLTQGQAIAGDENCPAQGYGLRCRHPNIPVSPEFPVWP